MGISNQLPDDSPPATPAGTPMASTSPTRPDRREDSLAAQSLPPSPAPGPAAPPSAARNPPRAIPVPRIPWLRSKIFLIGLGLGLIILAAYSNSFSAGLVLDNSVVIGDDPRIRAVNGDNIQLILTKNYWWPAFESNLYRPLTTMSYLINYRLFSHGAPDKFDLATVPSFHWVNFLLQWANVFLVLVIVRRLSGQLALATVAAALFAVHPVNVESVTNIVGRGDLLATLSILLGGWCYLRAAEATGWGKVAWLTGVAFNALWGIFAKESAVLLAAFVFLYDLIWRWPRLPEKKFFPRLGRAILEFGVKGYVALAPALLALLIARSRLTFYSPVFGEVFADNPISGADHWYIGAMTAINVLGRYLLLMIFPRTLSCDYSYHAIPLYGDPGAGLQDLLTWVSLGVIVGLLMFAVKRCRTQPLFAWAVGIFFLMQLPTMNLLLSIGSIMAERFLYLPSIGFCVAAAQFLWWIGGFLVRHARWPRLILGWSLAGAATFALGARTHARNADWQTEYSLWQSASAAEPDSFKVHKGFANCLWGEALAHHKGDWVAEESALDAAITEAEKGLSILDHPPLPLPKEDNTLFKDLGMFYLLKGAHVEHRGQTDEARGFYQKSVAVLLRAVEVDHYANKTSHETSLRRGRLESEISDVGNYNIYTLLVVSYEHLKDWTNAETYARYIQRLVPLDTIGYRLAATECANQGRVGDAAVLILEALFLDPRDGSLFQTLGTYYSAMGLVPNPVNPFGNNFSLNQDVPLVRQELNQAGVDLVRHLEDCKQHEAAAALRDKFIASYKIPAELFIRK